MQYAFRRRYSSTLSIFTVFVVLLCSGLVEAALAQGRPIATVQTARGQVSVKRRSRATYVALRARNDLNAGDVVATGANGKASLLFYNGAQLRLNARTTIEITSPTNAGRGKTSLFRAIGGEVWARLRPGQAAQTRSAIAGVRGTEFVLQVAEDETTTLTVVEGEVQFFNPLGEVLVLANQQSVARPGSAPTKPVTIQNAGLIIEWTVDLNSALIPRETSFTGLNRAALQTEIARRTATAQQQPNDLAAQRALGDAIFDAGRYDAALAQYQKALAINAQDEATVARLGHAYLELGQLEEAATTFGIAIGLNPDSVPGLLGLSAVELAREQPVAAQEAAQRAIAADAKSAEAHIALGLALMRQGGKQDEAANAMRAALQAEPANLHYQARAWLAMIYLAQDDQVAAQREGQEAVKLAPESGLAHGNLALVYFFSGNTRAAEREARLATRLNPDSIAAQVALGQTLLAQGDVDAATATAARAVALDPGLPQAHYLLGVADAGRRDWTHAARSLREAVRLSPDFLPAASALARVYNNMGRQGEAVTLLTDLVPRNPQSHEVHAALGQVYYQQGQYEKGFQEYAIAVRENPTSALYHAELARVAVDANHLNEAITAGQKAVALAPQVAQYHAILGLAFDYSSLSWRGAGEQAGFRAQAEREFRTALTLDPQNALARARLATLQVLADADTGVNAYTQAFLYDPSISNQLVRGGVNTSITPSISNNSEFSGNLRHNQEALDGKLHSFTILDRTSREGKRENNERLDTFYNEFATYVLGPRTTLLAGLTGVRVKEGLPGRPSTSFGDDADDYRSDRSTQGLVAARHRLGAGNHLWLGVGYDTFRGRTDEPSYTILDGTALSQFGSLFRDLLPGVIFIQTRADTTFRQVQPEIRADFTLGRASQRPTLFTVGGGYARTESNQGQRILLVGSQASLGAHGSLYINNTSTAAYAQASRQMSDRLSLIGQLRWQRSQRDGRAVLSVPGASVTRRVEFPDTDGLFPGIVATYQANKNTSLRFFANRRGRELASFAFAPTETLFTTESDVLPRNDFFVSADILQLDVERYLPNGSVKLFAFHTTTRDLEIGSNALDFMYQVRPDALAINLDKVRRTGAGARLEQRLGRSLYGSAVFVFNRSIANAPDMPFDNRTAPYQPKYRAAAALDYLDPKGNKWGIILRREGSFFQDDPTDTIGNPNAPRPRFPARTYVDLRLAKEPSVHHEFFAVVRNVFDRPTLYYQGFPGPGRQYEIGYTRRF